MDENFTKYIAAKLDSMASILALSIMLAGCGKELPENSDGSTSKQESIFQSLLQSDVSDLDEMGDGYLWKAKFCTFADCTMDFFESTGSYRTDF